MSAPQDPQAMTHDDAREHMGLPRTGGQQPSTLDRLYSMAGHAQAITDDLTAKANELAEQITARQAELQKQRAAADQAGDKAAVEQIDNELAQLDEAYQTLIEDLDARADEHQDAHGAGDQRGRGGNPGRPGA